MNYTVKLRGRDVKIRSHDLLVFRDMYVDDTDLIKRMSELLWLDIYILDAEFGLSPHDILAAIRSVETGERAAEGVKPATKFNNQPLRGLWHKHFFSAHFLVDNILLGLGKNGMQKLIEEVMDPKKSPIITQEMINELAHRVTHEPAETRAARNKLTGEWLVYLPHQGKNYYLCCNTHKAGDQFIYDRIMEHCVRDFPDLPAWLRAAAAT